MTKKVKQGTLFWVKWKMPLVICAGKDGLIVKMVNLPAKSPPVLFVSSLN